MAGRRLDGWRLGRMQEFTARIVGIEKLEDLNTFLIVLCESPTGEGARLELQRSLCFDEQDRKYGMNTYCICTQTGACHYGGIEWYRCDDNSLTIALRSDAATALGVSSVFRITLDIDSASSAKLRAALPSVLVEVQDKP